MVRSMRLFLIRHGETVDNVAHLYAGSRDSALTNHGHQQATRLGLHFKTLGLTFTHLFSSHLQRAARTAGLIKEAQVSVKDDFETAQDAPEVVQLRILMEQDFGDLEGKKWSDMQAELQKKPGFAAIETKEAMGQRADVFLDQWLLPLLEQDELDSDLTVAVVSHGIFLSTLWKRLLRRLPARSISLSSDLQSIARPSLEHLGGWSNTGYLELLMTRHAAEVISLADVTPSPTSKPDMPEPGEVKPDDVIGVVDAPQHLVDEAVSGTHVSTSSITDDAKLREEAADAVASSAPPAPTTPRAMGQRMTLEWVTTILTINGKDHLKGLKRTGGGVGSSRYDTSQRGIDSFFKRRKVE